MGQRRCRMGSQASLKVNPPLNENKTMKENVMEGVQKIYDALTEYEDIKKARRLSDTEIKKGRYRKLMEE